jgi:hypothetical protein
MMKRIRIALVALLVAFAFAFSAPHLGSTCTTTTCGPGIVNAAQVVAAAAFNKSLPDNGTTSLRNTRVTLQWGVSSNATSYQYCVDTVNNNACDTVWVNVGAATSVAPSGLLSARIYYWQVQALNLTGTTNANGGTWWRFSTR